MDTWNDIIITKTQRRLQSSFDVYKTADRLLNEMKVQLGDVNPNFSGDAIQDDFMKRPLKRHIF